jgi:hypothetical protein
MLSGSISSSVLHRQWQTRHSRRRRIRSLRQRTSWRTTRETSCPQCGQSKRGRSLVPRRSISRGSPTPVPPDSGSSDTTASCRRLRRRYTPPVSRPRRDASSECAKERQATARTRRCSPSSPPGSSSCLLELRPQGDHVVRDLGALGGGKELLRRATCEAPKACSRTVSLPPARTQPARYPGGHRSRTGRVPLAH